MSDFTNQPAPQQLAPPDPAKHVNYTMGMVLGVDDFVQEFAYLSGRDQWMLRDLIGYGTVWGLQVGRETTVAGTRITVAHGVAVSPSGQLIRVTPAQCASLDDWLKSRAADVQKNLAHTGSPSAETVSLYLVLSYRACPTDEVPVPGEPCRTQDESMAASRWEDEFELDLRFAPPPLQIEEEAIRAFAAWLNQQIEITDAPGTFVSLKTLLDTIRASAPPVTSPPNSASLPQFAPPNTSLRISPANAREYLRAILCLWVTELRPRWHRDWLGGAPACGCVSSPPETSVPHDPDCVLLAELAVPLKSDGTLGDPNLIAIHEEERPFLVHSRLLQEFLGLASGTATAQELDAVQHPANVGGYKIVAAGVMQGNGSTISAYNNLHNAVLGPPVAGELKFTFGGYNANNNYVIKATPFYSDVQNTLLKADVSVAVVDPLAGDGFILRVTDGSGNPIGSTLSGLKFMIEVSQY